MSVKHAKYGFMETSPGSDALELSDLIKPHPTVGMHTTNPTAITGWPHAP